MLGILPEQSPAQAFCSHLQGGQVPNECQGLLQHPHHLLIAGRWDAGMGSGAADAFQRLAPNHESFSCWGGTV